MLTQRHVQSSSVCSRLSNYVMASFPAMVTHFSLLHSVQTGCGAYQLHIWRVPEVKMIDYSLRSSVKVLYLHFLYESIAWYLISYREFTFYYRFPFHSADDKNNFQSIRFKRGLISTLAETKSGHTPDLVQKSSLVTLRHCQATPEFRWWWVKLTKLSFISHVLHLSASGSMI
jgi:hypothetical protein